MNDIVKEKLDNFLFKKNIPHILFHGENISKCIEKLNYLLDNIYPEYNTYKENTLYVNCAYGKGINFIRQQLKFFAKTNVTNIQKKDIDTNNKVSIPTFKSIVLLHADFLTIDAQSALRRCIEQYSHKTRFFMVILNKDSVIKPIQSRFCDIYINKEIDNKENKHMDVVKQEKNKHRYLKKILTNMDIEKQSYLGNDIFDIASLLYNKGIYYQDFIDVFDNIIKDLSIKYGLITYINKIRHDIKNEKLLNIHILNIFCLRSNLELENIYPF